MKTKSGMHRSPLLISGLILLLLLTLMALAYGERKKSTAAETILADVTADYHEALLENEALTKEHQLLMEENALLQDRLNAMDDGSSEKERLLLELEEANLRLEEVLAEALEKRELFIYKGLVRVLDIDASLVIDLRYATEENFTGKRVYPQDAPALLTLETALKLKKANERVEKDGYHIKIWDGYRPLSVQKIFWDLVPDPRYVADPAKGSVHNRGASVDVTLVDAAGKELEMPTAYDDFSEKAGRNYQGSSETARKNMAYLTKIMEEAGFTGVSTEWWHYDDKSLDKPLLNVDFTVFN